MNGEKRKNLDLIEKYEEYIPNINAEIAERMRLRRYIKDNMKVNQDSDYTTGYVSSIMNEY